MDIINVILLISFILSLLQFLRSFISYKFLNPSEPKMFEQQKMTNIFIFFVGGPPK